MKKATRKMTTTMGSAVLDTDKVELPTVEVGELVLWSPDHGGSPAPGLCVAVGGGENRSRIDVQIIHLESMTLELRTGVPHRDDPRNKIVTDEDVGVWRVGPLEKRLRRMEEDIEDLKLSLAGSPKDLGELATKGEGVGT